MRASRRERREKTLRGRSKGLGAFLEDAREVVGEERTGELAELHERVSERTARSLEHTLIGFFGATGSGKSSLVNAITGSHVATVAHRRPTTSSPLAAIVGEADEDAHALLDWIGVSERHVVDRASGEEGTIYLDLPDIDSVEESNREIARTLASQVDALVWVTDPEKYADAVLHSQYIRRYASHDAVTIVLLNQADRLTPAQREEVRFSLEDLVRAHGLADARVIPVSAADGTGIESARDAFRALGRQKVASLERLSADLTATAQDAATLVGAQRAKGGWDIPNMPRTVPSRAIEDLAWACANAAQVDAIAEAVRRSYTLQSAKRTGWPALRWLLAAKADPLQRLRLGGASGGGETGEEFVSHSSIDLDSPRALSSIRAGAERFTHDVAGSAPRPWPQRLDAVLTEDAENLPEALDHALTHTRFRGSARSWFWTPLNILQWLAFLVAIAGLVWILAVNTLAFFQIPKPPMPMIEELWVPIPYPTAMIVAGLGLGILLALLMAFINRAVAAYRARRARAAMRAAIRTSLEDTVVKTAQAELDRVQRIEQSLAAMSA